MIQQLNNKVKWGLWENLSLHGLFFGRALLLFVLCYWGSW